MINFILIIYSIKSKNYDREGNCITQLPSQSVLHKALLYIVNNSSKIISMEKTNMDYQLYFNFHLKHH